MRKRCVLIIFLTLLCISFLFAGCSRKAEKVSLKEVETMTDTTPDNTGIKIAVSAIISPKKTFIYYKEVLEYIAKETGIDIKGVTNASIDLSFGECALVLRISKFDCDIDVRLRDVTIQEEPTYTHTQEELEVGFDLPAGSLFTAQPDSQKIPRSESEFPLVHDFMDLVE